MSSKFYITTAIAYVNAAPHMGHTMEYIMTDAIARYMRMIGRETHFLTGTDEHGTKIYNTALKAGEQPQAFVDKFAQTFIDLKQTLNLSWDDFIRTTDQKRHFAGCQKLWEKLEEAGDLYLKDYEGLYCEGCETFIPEKDLVEGKCAIHLKAPVLVKESNYFFRLSKYSDAIKKLFETGALKIVPEYRQHEFMALLNEGLHDVSFSRPKSTLPWGIPVPGNPDQMMYVWCDALTNYISALDYAHDGPLFKKFWPADMHVIGKDIVRFHAGIWIGMLLSAKIAPPKAILVHGFLTRNGQKMSKSLGNVLDPIEVVQTYGIEALRYYLLREIPVGRDGDFSDQLFKDRYNAELANNLGNLVNRLHNMAGKYEVKELKPTKAECHEAIKMALEAYHAHMTAYELHEAVQVTWRLIDFANKRIDDTKPWALAKTDLPATQQVLMDLLEVLRNVAFMITPFLPETGDKIRSILGFGEGAWKGLGEAKILFPRIE
jgi:methionyl-tRNA synthetase